MNRSSRPETGFIGAGRLARALAPAMSATGYRVVAVSDRRPAAARALSRLLPGADAFSAAEPTARRAGLLLLSVPDSAIRDVASSLARLDSVDWRRRVVLHHSGSLGTEPLRALERVGAGVGLLHPLQCFGGTAAASDHLPGSRARIEGSGRARAVALRLARDLGLVPLRFSRPLGPGRRAAYHAAAALVSNDLTALLSLAVDSLVASGVSRQSAVGALVPLARGTLSQAETGDLRAALSGPVVRGDVKTVQAHLDALSRRSGSAAEIHRLLSTRLLEVARRNDCGPDDLSSRRVAELLDSVPGRVPDSGI